MCSIAIMEAEFTIVFLYYATLQISTARPNKCQRGITKNTKSIINSLHCENSQILKFHSVNFCFSPIQDFPRYFSGSNAGIPPLKSTRPTSTHLQIIMSTHKNPDLILPYVSLTLDEQNTLLCTIDRPLVTQNHNQSSFTQRHLLTSQLST